MTDAAPPSAADTLADRFWDGILELSPISATVFGYERGADRLDDPGPAGRDQARRLYTDTLADVERLTADPQAESDPARATEDGITLDMLGVICRIGLEQLDDRVDRLKVVDQGEGPQTLLPLLASMQPMDTPERFDAFLARLAAYPAFMDANAEVAREGLDAGLTAARIVTERVIAQVERVLSLPPEQSPIVNAARPPKESDRERLVAAVREYVQPADRRFLEALQGDYLAASRAEPGLWSAPNGEKLYRTQIRAYTTLEADPAEVHRVGRAELEAIEAERRVIARELGFGDDTAAARRALRAAPDSIPASAEEYLDQARGHIDRAYAAAPRYFGRLPKAAVEVRPVEAFKEADAPPAYYYPPAVDGSRPGIFYVNTYDLPSRSYVSLANVSFHEAVPGHHFQIALDVEHPELNVFRRVGARMAGSAFTEGWGLYSERLADEMGLYRTSAERFGMLDGQAWRAVRLIVDTGIHALQWTREQSVELLESGGGLSHTDALSETDRYISWPGQALTYKLGQREIERLRTEIAGRLGSRFDLRAFHDQILGHGTLPLVTLSRELPRWLGAGD